MTWLTWRQFRTQTLVTLAALAAIAVTLGSTGPPRKNCRCKKIRPQGVCCRAACSGQRCADRVEQVAARRDRPLAKRSGRSK